jgi:hypothetical protein
VKVADNNAPTLSDISDDSQDMLTSYSKNISSLASDLD